MCSIIQPRVGADRSQQHIYYTGQDEERWQSVVHLLSRSGQAAICNIPIIQPRVRAGSSISVIQARVRAGGTQKCIHYPGQGQGRQKFVAYPLSRLGSGQATISSNICYAGSDEGRWQSVLHLLSRAVLRQVAVSNAPSIQTRIGEGGNQQCICYPGQGQGRFICAIQAALVGEWILNSVQI